MKPEKRKQRLQQLLDKFAIGKDVSARDIKNILTDSEYSYYKNNLEYRKLIPVGQKPQVLKIYEALLRDAMFAYSKLDTYSQKPFVKYTAIKNLQHQVDKTFERCREYLQENQSMQAGLYDWLDRDVDFDNPETKIEPITAGDLPKPITSRSYLNEFNRIKSDSIRDVKIKALKMALESIDNPQQDHDENDAVLESLEKLNKKKVKRDIDASDWKF